MRENKETDYLQLKNRLQDDFDTRYKKLVDCDETSGRLSQLLSKDNVRLVVIEHQQKINNWLTLAIASGIIALVIKEFFGG